MNGTRNAATRNAAWLVFAFGAFAATAQASRVYVSNEDGQSVSVIDGERAAVIATIEVGKRPRGLKLNRDGSRLYVAVSGLPKCPPTVPDEECAKLERDLKADGIAIIDTASHKVLGVLKAGSDPEQFAISSDGKRLFVANEDAAMVSVVEIESGTVVQRIPVGREPEGVGVTPDGRWVLVTNESDNSISVIDADKLKVVNTVRVGQRPRDVAFTPDSRAAYVTGEFDASLYRISVPDGEPVKRVLQMREQARPMAVLLDADRDRLYMSTGRGGSVAVIDPAGPKLLAEIPVGTRPWGIALSDDGRRLYTANGPSNDVSVIDTSTLRVVKRIPVGKSPWGVTVGPAPPSKEAAGPGAAVRVRARADVHARLPCLSPGCNSGCEPAGAMGAGLRVPKEPCHLLRLVGVAEDRPALAGQPGVAGVSRGFDEIVIAQPVRELIDRARALVQARELVAVTGDALIDVFNACLRRVVVYGRLAPDGRGAPQQRGCAEKGGKSVLMA